MADNSPWWVIITATLGGKPAQASALQFPDKQTAQAHTADNSASEVVGGPFKTGPDADTFAATYFKAHPLAAPGIYNPSTNAAASSGNPITAAGAQAGSLVPFGDIATALSAFYAKLTDGKMWRSLGWLVLGVVLIVVGLLMWVGPTAFSASPYGRALGAIRGARA